LLARRTKLKQGATARLSVRLLDRVALEMRADGEMAACVDSLALGLGRFSAAAAKRARDLRTGVPLQSFASRKTNIDKEVDRLVRRLAARGLIEYRLAGSAKRESALKSEDQVIIEPQLPDYWPQMPKLRDTDRLVLSRFAYMRRRANVMVLESPRGGALFRIGNPQIAALLVTLSVPQQVGALRRRAGFPAGELLALLVDSHVLFKVGAKDDGSRPYEGGDDLIVWDFHDLLFHARSTEGRHANPAGGAYLYVGAIDSPPAVRPAWRGERIDLGNLSGASPEPASPMTKLLRERRSIRNFDDQHPITLAELSRFLDATARVRSTEKVPLVPEAGPGGPMLTHTLRPYPSAGASYELELYLAVDKCQGLPRGFFHYDAGTHALTRMSVEQRPCDTWLKSAQLAMGDASVPQILIIVAARFGRMSWKYSSIAYALVLKDVGVLLQTFYMMATDMGLGGCAIGTANIELFAKMTGLEFHVEGPVGQFALGRPAKSPASS
jgi:SagB-type dehydrogenase family enzyme